MGLNNRIAISYSRFSSKQQEQSDSLRRQRETFDRACKQHELIEYQDYKPLIDNSKSGFKGEHLKAGADLFGFIQALESGALSFPDKVILVIEKWDRIGRLKNSLTQGVLSTLLTHVDILDCSDQQLITSETEDDLGASIQLLIKIHSAYLYSKTISDRVGEAKRQQLLNSLENKTPLPNGNIPKWLKLNGTKPNYSYTINTHRAETIQLMFKLYNSGMSMGAIAKKFNTDDIAGWDRRGKDTSKEWNALRISGIIRSQSTCGYHVSRTLKKDLTEFESYSNKNTKQGLEIKIYPEVVSETTWKIAQANKQKLALHSDKKNHQRDGNNILQGLVCCARCASNYVYRKRNVARVTTPQLNCSKRDLGGDCDNSSLYYPLVEQAVLSLVFDENNIAHLLQEQTDSSNEKQQLLLAEKSKYQRDIIMLEDVIDSEDIPDTVLVIQLSKLNKKVGGIDSEIQALVKPETENVELAK